MDLIKLVEIGYRWTGERIARVRPGDGDLAAATPCAEWDVRAVLNHMIGAIGFMCESAGGKEDPVLDAGIWATRDLIGSDPASAFAAATERARRVWQASGVMERQCVMPFGLEPGRRMAQRSLTDVVVRGWDLSRGLGENAGVPDELAEPLWEIAHDLMDRRLRAGPFAPEVPFAGGSASDRLVAFLDRQP